jgi:hypothetical protein
LVHSEDSLVIESIKQNNMYDGDFIYYQGFQGPIKIWKINYPSNIKVEEKYLETAYPNKELELAKSGKYGN